MSEYVYKKVIRYKLPDKIGTSMDKYDFLEELESKFPDQFRSYKNNYKGKFKIAGTDKDTYLDYILTYECDSRCGEYGRCRLLTFKELDKYDTFFRDLLSNTNLSNDDFNIFKLRLVEVCYYNGSDEPDYYDAEDEFMKEV